MDKDTILITVLIVEVFILRIFLKWREGNKQRIIANVSDETCHKCRHNSHKRMMFKEVRKRAEENALKSLSNVVSKESANYITLPLFTYHPSQSTPHPHLNQRLKPQNIYLNCQLLRY